jgi:hypothetical protein
MREPVKKDETKCCWCLKMIDLTPQWKGSPGGFIWITLPFMFPNCGLYAHRECAADVIKRFEQDIFQAHRHFEEMFPPPVPPVDLDAVATPPRVLPTNGLRPIGFRVTPPYGADR